MIATIIIGLLLLLALVWLLIGGFTMDAGTDYERRLGRVWALVPVAIALAVAGFACTAVVQAKQEGVLLTFGKASERTLDPGLNFKLPWQKVVSVDATRKTDNFNDGSPNAEDNPTQDHGSIECTLGDNGIGTIKASVSWRPADDQGNDIYAEYRSDDPAERLREDLVVPRFRDAVNQVCGTYRPTAQIDSLNVDFSDPQETTKALQDLNLAPDFPQLSSDVRDVLEGLLAQGGDPLVEVINVSVSRLALPESSQKKIQAFLDEVSKTRIALQSQATNRAQAEANRLLQGEEGDLTELVLVSRCLDLIDSGALALPAGSSCWPGARPDVVVPAQ